MIDLILSVLFVDTSLKSQETRAQPQNRIIQQQVTYKEIIYKNGIGRTTSNNTVTVTTLRPEAIAEQEGERVIYS